MPGLGHSKEWWAEYEALRGEGKSKSSAAKITNATRRNRGRRTRPSGTAGHRKRAR